MDIKEQVLKVMKEAGKPVSAGEVEKLSGLDRKDIDKAFQALKKEEAIVSPVRCKWEPANKEKIYIKDSSHSLPTAIFLYVVKK